VCQCQWAADIDGDGVVLPVASDFNPSSKTRDLVSLCDPNDHLEARYSAIDAIDSAYPSPPSVFHFFSEIAHRRSKTDNINIGRLGRRG
jgi:hypothetical protein